jgi:hypothetical protein
MKKENGVTDKATNLKEEFKRQMEETHAKHEKLLKNIKDHMPELEEALERATSHWDYEDPIYRFYHHSFKVYHIQEQTESIVELLRKLSPEENKPMDKYFEEIYLEGTHRNRVWQLEHNAIWTTTTRPFLEAFFHAKYFLEMVVKYGKELDEAPNSLPSGWASILCLYNLR